MLLKNLLSQQEYNAYLMSGKDYTEGHPTYHHFVSYEQRGYYLVIEGSENSPSRAWNKDWIILQKEANNYILMNATDDEKQLLVDSGYKMIGLRG